MSGIKPLEKKLLEENARLLGENNFLKALLQDVGGHLIDCVDAEAGESEWMCRCCGARAPLKTDTDNQKDYPHEPTCALYVKE